MANTYFDQADFKAINEYTKDIQQLFVKDTPFPDVDAEKLELASWWLSGFTVLCDWLGSSKNYAPILVEAQRFAFMLRINPVITVKGKRHDVVMHRKHQMDYKKLVEEKKPHLSTQQIAEEDGEKWLASRAQRGGFTLESIRIDAYELRTTGKKRGKKAIRYSTMDLQGILTLTDSETFEKTLMQGIGKAKAFGCGLILIRKV